MAEPAAEPPAAPASPPVAPPVMPMVAVQVASQDAALRRGAGIGLLWAAAGLVAGAALAGPLGAAAGLSAVGAARNGLRAKRLWTSPVEADRVEAGKSATMAVFGVGIAGVLIYYHANRD